MVRTKTNEQLRTFTTTTTNLLMSTMEDSFYSVFACAACVGFWLHCMAKIVCLDDTMIGSNAWYCVSSNNATQKVYCVLYMSFYCVESWWVSLLAVGLGLVDILPLLFTICSGHDRCSVPPHVLLSRGHSLGSVTVPPSSPSGLRRRSIPSLEGSSKINFDCEQT